MAFGREGAIARVTDRQGDLHPVLRAAGSAQLAVLVLAKLSPRFRAVQ